ncbi:hypothetical protein Tco_0603702, partial [Tanacetum coccineum]
FEIKEVKEAHESDVRHLEGLVHDVVKLGAELVDGLSNQQLSQSLHVGSVEGVEGVRMGLGVGGDNAGLVVTGVLEELCFFVDTPLNCVCCESVIQDKSQPSNVLVLLLDQLNHRNKLGELWDCQLGNLTAGKV